MYFDTHAHYDDKAFDADRLELLEGLPSKGVSHIVNPGCDVLSSRRAIELAERFPHVYAAVGIHPGEIESCRQGDLQIIEELAAHPKCLAIGEIGLDYYWEPYDKEAQIKLLRRQLDMAMELDLPVSLHIRDAYGDAMEVLTDYPGLKGVMHCFSGSAEIAERCVRMGLYVAFGGSLTFKNNKKAPAAAAVVPPDRLLLETDCPYMAPVPHRGKRCLPAMTAITCEKLAEIKGIDPAEMERIAYENAVRLFGL